MQAAVTNEQAVALALAALGWIVSGPARAQRLLDLTASRRCWPRRWGFWRDMSLT
jgi:hypothetical protein